MLTMIDPGRFSVWPGLADVTSLALPKVVNSFLMSCTVADIEQKIDSLLSFVSAWHWYLIFWSPVSFARKMGKAYLCSPDLV